MATEKPRFSLTISDDVLKEIEKFQVENKISTRNKAIQKLVEKGMAIAAEREQAVQKAEQPAEIDELFKLGGKYDREVIGLLRDIPADYRKLALDLVTSVLVSLLRNIQDAEEKVPVSLREKVRCNP